MRRLPAWALALSVLLLAGYAVPYLVLTGIQEWQGAFLFWIGFGLCVWILLVLTVMRWRLDQAAE